MNIAPELPDKADEPAGAGLKVDDQSGHTTVHLTGNWQAATIGSVNGPMQELAARAAPASAITLDLSGLGNLDTAGAWLITRLSNAWREKGGNVSLANVSEHRSRLLAAVDYTGETGERTGRSRNILLGPVEALGRVMYSLHRDTLMGFNIIGAAIHGPQLKSGKGGGVRPVSIIHHIDRMGLHSAPIIILVSFLIGGIIAQQSAFQMRTFGLENWAVGLTAILLLREVCVLITAIMIAGRSGSAMTAEIGSMKMREEVDALTVIGLNPIGVLIFPRLVALTISLPLLTFISDMAALAGAAILLRFYSGVGFAEFLTQLGDWIDLTTVFSGLIKAPFMAMIIGVMAAVEGMKVEGSAESLGRRVTSAVVKAIFFVIVVDGFFAIFYAAIDY